MKKFRTIIQQAFAELILPYHASQRRQLLSAQVQNSHFPERKGMSISIHTEMNDHLFTLKEISA